MKVFREHIVVKVPSIFIDESRYEGVEGKKLIIDVLYNPEHHVRYYGEVVSVPDELFRYPLSQDHIGLPEYHEDAPYNWKTNEDIKLEVSVGDKVYFHYNCLLPDQMGASMYNKMYLWSKKEEENGKIVTYHYFRIKYDLIFANVRYEKTCAHMNDFKWWMESKLSETTVAADPTAETEFKQSKLYMHKDDVYRKIIIMIGSYVLIEPDMETWDDISIPLPVIVNGKKLINPDGSVKMRPKEEWLVTKREPEEKHLRGWVRYCGSPLKGDKEFLRPGVYIYFQRHANTSIRFEGADYFRMRQRYVIAIDHTKSNLYETV